MGWGTQDVVCPRCGLKFIAGYHKADGEYECPRCSQPYTWECLVWAAGRRFDELAQPSSLRWHAFDRPLISDEVRLLTELTGTRDNPYWGQERTGRLPFRGLPGQHVDYT